MRAFISISLISMISSASWAALPPQFADCMSTEGSASSVYDVKEIAKVAKVNYCQNQIGLTNKYDTIDLLKTRNVNVGISVSKTTYTQEDLSELAKSGSYVLYVDGTRIAKEYLNGLASQGVQLVVMSATAGLANADLLNLAKTRPFVYNVNSTVVKEDVKALVAAGVTVVFRSNASGLTKEQIVEIAKVNPDLVTLSP
ncbi:hypothetical protein B9G69_006385 [Bdellovibrio sp. SKB1291214]|uniref:hypothetical protein n=1 Tax=Bdellovibrio sp. SKB1291214 TaxID=1732569 RepID=UPI000B517214|nr:hypothetical protein [Bdellovibrio sp. SKB1291214]UYL10205.1 hypothetical protein B9G69_006385 [Bdellovibrio sp. SKB1291214]